MRTAVTDGDWFAAVRARLARQIARPQRERLELLGVALFFIALFVVHARWLGPLLQNGDSAVYNQQVEQHDLSHRTTHVGYFALGVLFNALLPFGTDVNMNVMVLSIGFLGLIAVYSTSQFLGEARWAALASVVVALGLSALVRGMLLSEVDAVSAAFVAIAFACAQRGATWVAGALFGFAVLVTPLSGPLVVLFVLTLGDPAPEKASAIRHRLQQLLKFGVGALLVYAPVVLTRYRDYVFGPRGLVHAPRAALSVSQRINHSFHFIAQELGYMLPLYLAGAALCLVSPKLKRVRPVAIALSLSIGLMAVVGERFLDVPVQLPNLLLLGILPAAALARSGRWVRLALLLLFAVGLLDLRGSYDRVLADLHSRERDRAVCLAIREQSAPKSPVLVGLSGFSQSRTFERYASTAQQPALTLEWREFFGQQRRWLEPAAQTQIWFFRELKSNKVTPLLERYSLESRRAGGRRLKVLVPLPANAVSTD